MRKSVGLYAVMVWLTVMGGQRYQMAKEQTSKTSKIIMTYPTFKKQYDCSFRSREMNLISAGFQVFNADIEWSRDGRKEIVTYINNPLYPTLYKEFVYYLTHNIYYVIWGK